MKGTVSMTVEIENLKTIVPISVDELKKLHTGSLLSRLKSLRELQDSYEVSDWLPEERDAVQAAGLIAFRKTTSWETAFSDLKSVLSEREHIPRGSKEKRQQAAQQKKNR